LGIFIGSNYEAIKLKLDALCKGVKLTRDEKERIETIAGQQETEWKEANSKWQKAKEFWDEVDTKRIVQISLHLESLGDLPEGDQITCQFYHGSNWITVRAVTNGRVLANEERSWRSLTVKEKELVPSVWNGTGIRISTNGSTACTFQATVDALDISGRWHRVWTTSDFHLDEAYGWQRDLELRPPEKWTDLDQ
jgi:hypothetical protein